MSEFRGHEEQAQRAPQERVRPPRVLVIEDNPDHRVLLRRLIEGELGAVRVDAHASDEIPPQREPVLLAFVALDADPEPTLAALRALGQKRPPVIALRGRRPRFSDEEISELAPLSMLDKRSGQEFVASLRRTLAPREAREGEGEDGGGRQEGELRGARSFRPSSALGPGHAAAAEGAATERHRGSPAAETREEAGEGARPGSTPGPGALAAGGTRPPAQNAPPFGVPREPSRPRTEGPAAPDAQGDAALLGPSAPRETRPSAASERPPKARPFAPPAPGRERLPKASARGAERDLAVATLLVDEMRRVLARLGPLGSLMRDRYPADRVLGRYVEALKETLARADELGAVVTDLPATPPTRTRRVGLDDLVRLRLPAWRTWLTTDSGVSIDVEPGTPAVDAHVELLGALLDELVSSLAAGCSRAPRLHVRLGPRHTVQGDALLLARLELRLDGEHAAARSDLPEDRQVFGRAAALLRVLRGRFEVLRSAGERVVGFALTLPESGARTLLSPQAMASPGSVLVVDDERGIRELTEEMLGVKGFRVATAESGEQAVDLYRAGCRYDLVLLDMLMPGLDGHETFRALHAIDPQVRVVLVSGSATGNDLRSLLADGLLGFLPKPFSMQQLLEAVERALGGERE